MLGNRRHATKVSPRSGGEDKPGPFGGKTSLKKDFVVSGDPEPVIEDAKRQFTDGEQPEMASVNHEEGAREIDASTFNLTNINGGDN